jgi:Flp pilus assembly protein TadG
MTSQIRNARGQAILRRFASQAKGSIAVNFALLLIPITFAVGAAIDYSTANQASAKLDAVADAAALAAVNLSSMSGTAAAAQNAATALFNSQWPTVPDITGVQSTITVTDSGLTRTARVSYTAQTSTAFMGLAGINSIPISGGSTASAGFPTYIDFHLLLDNTPSMGVGATPADVAKMVNNTSDQCAFACHDVSNANSYYNLAKTLSVTMRIDVLRTATMNLMDTAAATETYSNQFRMAIYTFGSAATATPGMSKIQALTSNLSTAKQSAANIDLMTVDGQNQYGDQDTGFDTVIPEVGGDITAPGNGASAATPKKVLFFVTDGVADENNPNGCLKVAKLTSSGRCQEPIDPALCTPIKSNGVLIAVLYTTYLALPTNSWYTTYIAPFNPGPYTNPPGSINSVIAQNLQACASPGLYFEVSPTQGISEAMAALFQKTITVAHLTR